MFPVQRKDEEDVSIIEIQSTTPPNRRSTRFIEVKHELVEYPKHNRVKELASGPGKKRKTIATYIGKKKKKRSERETKESKLDSEKEST